MRTEEEIKSELEHCYKSIQGYKYILKKKNPYCFHTKQALDGMRKRIKTLKWVLNEDKETE